MAIHYGPFLVTDVRIGAAPVIAVYVGEERVWPTDVITGIRWTQAGATRVTQSGAERVTEGYEAPA